MARPKPHDEVVLSRSILLVAASAGTHGAMVQSGKGADINSLSSDEPQKLQHDLGLAS